MKNTYKLITIEILTGLYFLIQALTAPEASTDIYWELSSFSLASIMTTYGLYKIKQKTATS